MADGLWCDQHVFYSQLIMNKIKIAIFASGSGTNAERIIQYFNEAGHDRIEVVLVLSNKSSAYVLARAKKYNIPSQIFSRTAFYDTGMTLGLLQSNRIDLIVLAGFLWLVPPSLTKAYKNKIINIHPALLPKYGGKGMYGSKVHQSIIEANEQQSGITIHLVDEVYDHGRVLLQKTCAVSLDDTPDTLAKKIHKLEHQYFPIAIENYILQNADLF